MDALFANWSLPFFPSDGQKNDSHASQNASPKPSKKKPSSSLPGLLSVATLGAGLGLGLAPSLAAQRASIAAVVATMAPRAQYRVFPPDLPLASASLAIAGSPDAETEGAAEQNFRMEPQTGLEFPAQVEEGGLEKQLAGLGVRNKKLFGLKNLKIYAFGVYANPKSLYQTLLGKYGSTLPSNLKDDSSFFNDVLNQDTQLAVRLTIYYKGLKIGQVRSAFEESLGSKILKLSGKPQKDLLSSFTKLFKDDFKLERGTVIEISRLPQQVLVTKIGGNEVGRVKSPLLCRAFFELYLGDEPFDKQAKESARTNFAELYELGEREVAKDGN